MFCIRYAFIILQWVYPHAICQGHFNQPNKEDAICARRTVKAIFKG